MNDKREPVLVVLAAGMGSRYGGLKQIDSVDKDGHIIIDFSIYDAIRAGFKNVAFIIKREIERDFREVMDKHLAGKDICVKYVYQEIDKIPQGFSVPEGRVKPWGTAHAIACCAGVIDAPFAVINADDYYGANAFVKIYEFLKNTNNDGKSHYAMVGYKIKNTVTEEGTVSRGVCLTDSNSMLADITERTKVGVCGNEIYYIEDGLKYPLDPETTVSMNLWGFDSDFISECSERFTDFLREGLLENPDKCEFYMPSVVSMLINEGKADVRVFENTDKWYGVTYKEDKPKVVAAIAELEAGGIYPEKF